MAIEGAEHFREMTMTELEHKIEVTRKTLIEAKFKHRMGTTDSPINIRYLRRELARLLTVKNDAQSGRIPLKTQ